MQAGGACCQRPSGGVIEIRRAEDSSRGSTSFSKTKLASSGDDVSQDHVVSKASPSHFVLTAHAFTLAALQVPTLMPRSKAPQVCARPCCASEHFVRLHNLDVSLLRLFDSLLQLDSCAERDCACRCCFQAMGKGSMEGISEDAASNAAAVTPVGHSRCWMHDDLHDCISNSDRSM